MLWLVSRPMCHNLTHGVAELLRLLDGGGDFIANFIDVIWGWSLRRK